MAILNVNPTRMEMTNLKRKLATAQRGHKLLKDKRDELMQQFMGLIKENKRLRQELEPLLKTAQGQLAAAQSATGREISDVSLSLPKQSVSLTVEKKNIMSVLIPKYGVKFKTEDKNDIFFYGYAYTCADMDDAILSLSNLLPKLIRLAEVEKSCQLMASEIEKTRRRVNALEHVMIPRYVDTIRYISMKLDENERSTTTRLMKVKDMMLEQAHGYKASQRRDKREE